MRIPPHTVQRLHFVGIGGIGMSGIAEVLHNMGYRISGSDLVENANVERLRRLGVPITIGHASKNIAGAQALVISSDIKADNIEVVQARTMRIPVIRRAEMLAELMNLKLSVAISGTHGKTTTTSLMASLFETAGLDPTVVNGGVINAYGTNARMGKGEWIVVEADESDGSFVKLPGTIAVVTNIDPEHMNFYGHFDAVKQAYLAFVDRIPFYGLGVLCLDHPTVRELIPCLSDKRFLTYGFDENANIRATNLRREPEGITFDVDITASAALACRAFWGGNVVTLPRKISDLYLPMIGDHNVQNALSVVAVAQELGMNDDVLRQALQGFKGVKRRFTRTGESNGVTIIDDYAHHPVEIQTVIQSARQLRPNRIVVVAQPHRYSRVSALFSEFCQCFQGADHIIIAPIYGAGEAEIPGISAESLATGIRKTTSSPVYTLNEHRELPYLLRQILEPGNIVLCLGAGSITYWASQLPAQLDQVLQEDDVSTRHGSSLA